MSFPKGRPFHLLLGAALSLALGVTACGGDDGSSAQGGETSVPTVKIGELAELTGIGAEAYGPFVHNGIDLAVKKVGESGYLNDVAKLELKTVDDASDPTTAVTELNKFVRDDVPVVFESAITPINLALAPIATREGVLHIGVASAGTTNQPSEFIHMTDAITPMQTLAKYAVETMGLKRIGAVVDGDNEGLKTFLTGFKQGLEANGASGAVVTEQTVSTTDTDFSSVLTNLEKANVDAVLLIVTIPAAGNFIKQMAARSSFDDVAKLGQVVWNPPVATIAGKAAEGAIFPQQWLPSEDSPFLKAYTAAGYEQAANVYSVYGHDAMWLVAVAMKLTADAGQELDGKNIKAHMVEASGSPDFAKHRAMPEWALQESFHPKVPGLIATFDAEGKIVPAPAA